MSRDGERGVVTGHVGPVGLHVDLDGVGAQRNVGGLGVVGVGEHGGRPGPGAVVHRGVGSVHDAVGHRHGLVEKVAVRVHRHVHVIAFVNRHGGRPKSDVEVGCIVTAPRAGVVRACAGLKERSFPFAGSKVFTRQGVEGCGHRLGHQQGNENPQAGALHDFLARMLVYMSYHNCPNSFNFHNNRAQRRQRHLGGLKPPLNALERRCSTSFPRGFGSGCDQRPCRF